MEEKKQEWTTQVSDLLRRLVEIAQKPELNDSDRLLIYTSLLEPLPSSSEAGHRSLFRTSRNIYSKKDFQRVSRDRKKRIRYQRNHLLHGQLGDQLALWDDQEEIREDLNVAIIKLLIAEKPDLLVSALRHVLENSESASLLENRRRIEYAIGLLEALYQERESSGQLKMDLNDDPEVSDGD